MFLLILHLFVLACINVEDPIMFGTKITYYTQDIISKYSKQALFPQYGTNLRQDLRLASATSSLDNFNVINTILLYFKTNNAIEVYSEKYAPSFRAYRISQI